MYFARLLRVANMTCISNKNKFDESSYNKFFSYLLEGNRRQCISFINDCIENGLGIKEIYILLLQRALHDIGDLWQKNVVSVAQEHLATAIIQRLMMFIYQKQALPSPNGFKVLIACPGNELHEIGARMVADFFEIHGFDVKFVGSNIPVRDVVGQINAFSPDLIGVSCTMAFNLHEIKNVIDAVRETNANVKVFVGGYAFNKNPGLYKIVGADFYAADAEDALAKAKSFLLERGAANELSC